MIRALLHRLAPIDPLAVTHGVLDALEQNARERGETQAIHHLRAARQTVTREALKPTPTA